MAVPLCRIEIGRYRTFVRPPLTLSRVGYTTGWRQLSASTMARPLDAPPGRTFAYCRLGQLAQVQHGQAAGKQLAVNHPLAEDRAPRNPIRADRASKPAPMRRLSRVSTWDKRLRRTTQSIALPPSAARALRHSQTNSADAGSADTARARVEMRQQIKIHKTVVKRGDQGIGGGVGQTAR